MRGRAINQDIMTFAEKIKDLLKQEEISQAELGRLADVPGSTVGHWINDGAKPNVYAVLRIARVFKLEMDSLVDDEIPGYRKIELPAPPEPAENHDELKDFRLRDFSEYRLVNAYRLLELTGDQATNALSECAKRLKASPVPPPAAGDPEHASGAVLEPPPPAEPRKRRNNGRTA
jgi:transcriptional regulator with XRE-family HTH domain